MENFNIRTPGCVESREVAHAPALAGVLAALLFQMVYGNQAYRELPSSLV